MKVKVVVEDYDGQFMEWNYDNKEELLKDLSVMLKPSMFGLPGFKITIDPEV